VEYKTSALVSFAIFLVLLLLLFFINIQGGRQEEQSIVEDKHLIGYSIEKIAAIAVINDDKKFGIISEGRELNLVPSVEGDCISQQELQAFLFDIFNMSYIKKLQNHGSRIDYGFTLTQPQMTVFLDDGKKIRLTLGKKNHLNNGYYLTLDDSDSIYLISESLGSLFYKTPDDFRDRQVLPGISMKDIGLVQGVLVEFPSDDRTSFSISRNGSSGFELIKPMKNTIDFESFLSDLMFPLLNLTSKHRYIVDEITELPSVEILDIGIEIDSIDYVLSFYESVDGDVLITRNGSSDFFLIDSEFFPFKDIRYRDFLDGAIYHCNISEISSISLQDYDEDKNYFLEISGQSVTLSALLNGETVIYQDLMDLFSILVETGISRRIDSTSYNLPYKNQKPLFDMTIRKKDGTMDLLEYYPAEGDELLLAVNGDFNFTTYEKTILDIRYVLNHLMQ